MSMYSDLDIIIQQHTTKEQYEGVKDRINRYLHNEPVDIGELEISILDEWEELELAISRGGQHGCC